MEIKTLLIEILEGKHDDFLTKIDEVIDARKEYLSTMNFVNFNIGDRVRFTSKVRPNYLVGKEAIITGKKYKKVVVDLVDGRVGRYSGKGVTTPVSLIEKIPL